MYTMILNKDTINDSKLTKRIQDRWATHGNVTKWKWVSFNNRGYASQKEVLAVIDKVTHGMFYLGDNFVAFKDMDDVLMFKLSYED